MSPQAGTQACKGLPGARVTAGQGQGGWHRLVPSPLLSRAPIRALGGCGNSWITQRVEMLGIDTSVSSRAEARLSPIPRPH